MTKMTKKKLSAVTKRKQGHPHGRHAHPTNDGRTHGPGICDCLVGRDGPRAVRHIPIGTDWRACSACRQMGYHKGPFSSLAGLCIDCLQSELDAMMCPPHELRLSLTPSGGLAIAPGKTIELLKRDFQDPVRLRRFVSSQVCAGGEIVEDAGLNVDDIMIGDRSLIFTAGGLPVVMFSPRAMQPRFNHMFIDVSVPLIMRISNRSDMVRILRMGCVGLSYDTTRAGFVDGFIGGVLDSLDPPDDDYLDVLGDDT